MVQSPSNSNPHKNMKAILIEANYPSTPIVPSSVEVHTFHAI